jgi:uncharacterized protein (TIGR03067 family)
MEKLRGTWTLVSVEADGWELPRALINRQRFVWLIDGHKITHRPEVGAERQSTFNLDPTRSPGEITFTPLDGRSNGRRKRGIYRLENDCLKVCVNKDNDQLPTGFATKVRDGLRVLIFQRQAR